MFEVAILFVFIIVAWYVLPSFFKPCVRDYSTYLEPIRIPEDSTLRRHFIAHLKSDIEATLHPCPSDPVLQQRHNILVATELKDRLARASK